jgi:hypothetical protein
MRRSIVAFCAVLVTGAFGTLGAGCFTDADNCLATDSCDSDAGYDAAKGGDSAAPDAGRSDAGRDADTEGGSDGGSDAAADARDEAQLDSWVDAAEGSASDGEGPEGGDEAGDAELPFTH